MPSVMTIWFTIRGADRWPNSPFRSTGSRTSSATPSNDSRPCAPRWGRKSWAKSWPELVCIWKLRPSDASAGRSRHSPFPVGNNPRRRHERSDVTAKRPNHVWHVDLTTVPMQLGLWCPWSPWALPQSWPWCWWVVIVLDHYSRRVMGFALFRKTPMSVEVRSCVHVRRERSVVPTGASPVPAKVVPAG
jgi:hypothetical protein